VELKLPFLNEAGGCREREIDIVLTNSTWLPTMQLNDSPRFFCLHFEGPLTFEHTLPSGALVQALQNFQRAIYLLVMAEQGQEVRQRARIPKEIEKRYSLVCHLPLSGGYALPVVLGDTSDLLVDTYGVDALALKIKEITEAINTGDHDKVSLSIPDRYFRSGVLSAFYSMQPPKNSGVYISIEDFKQKKLLNGKTAREKIEQLRTAPEDAIPITSGYVAGELVEMKFQERRLKLKLLVSGHGLEANYSEDFEPVLLEHPRELIQVHGNIVYGPDGAPVSISDVDEILEIDDSPIEIFQFEAHGRQLKPRKNLSFHVNFDVDTQLFETQGSFGILLGGETRPDLEAQLYAELSMLWAEYVETSEDMLTEAARVLRKEYEEMLEDQGLVDSIHSH